MGITINYIYILGLQLVETLKMMNGILNFIQHSYMLTAAVSGMSNVCPPWTMASVPWGSTHLVAGANKVALFPRKNETSLDYILSQASIHSKIFDMK